ncbi:PorA family protein [Nocardiopsis coralliicola]
MRRTVAAVCIALGVFCLVLAPLMRFWLAGALMKTPMDYYSEQVNRGENVTYFSIEELELVEDATVEAYSTVRADVAASDDDVVVWDQFTWIEDTERDFAIQSSSRRAGHDRVTGEAVDCCDAAINEEPTPQSGQAWKFPFDVEQKDYEFFDTTAKETYPIEFDGEETIDGVETYKFVQEVEPTKIGERELPRSLVDMEGDGDVVADEMYSVTRTYWIEPNSGSPIQLSEDQHRGAEVDGEEVLVLFDGDLRSDQETIDNNVENAQTALTALPLLRVTGPLVLIGAGAVLAVGGGVLFATARRT